MTVKQKEKVIWLGQSVRAKFVSLQYEGIKNMPIILSLGEAINRPDYIESLFSKPLKPKFGICGKLMLDSGGFMMMANQNKALPLKKLLEIYRTTDADIFVSLDFPPALNESITERRDKYARTYDAFLFLYEHLGPQKLMPVVHGRSVDEVDSNISLLKKINPEFSYIGLGGIVPLLKQKNNGALSDGRHSKEHIRSMIQSIKSSFPNSSLHAFGVGSPATILALMAMGADSVDSVGWRFAANFGTIYLPGTPARFPTKKIIHTRRGRLALKGNELTLLKQCDCPVCRGKNNLEDRLLLLNSSYSPRAAHNAWVIKNEVLDLSKAIENSTHRSFIKTRVNKNWQKYL